MARGSNVTSTSLGLSTLILLASIPAAHALKYQQWFYWYDRPTEPTLSNLSTGICKSEVEAYWQAAVQGAYNGSNAVTWCYLAEDCLLANMRPSFIQNYQAGAVILGILVCNSSRPVLPGANNAIVLANSSSNSGASNSRSLSPIHPPPLPFLSTFHWRSIRLANSNLHVR